MSFTVGTLPDGGPYTWDRSTKRAFFLDATRALDDHHRALCPAYRRVADLLTNGTFDTIEDVPFLPVRLFKERLLASVPAEHIVKTVTSSGTSSQIRSRIALDRTAAINQTKALSRIVSDFTGSKRLPTLVIDSAATLEGRSERSARAAGIIGFASLGRNLTYALDSAMTPDFGVIEEFLARFGGAPFLVFGFTSILWEHFYKPLAALNRSFDMSCGILFHGGGWKRLAAESVCASDYKNALHTVGRFGAIHDYYGMAEQAGSIFVECEQGRLHAPIFSDVLIRRFDDFSAASFGERGLVQLLSLLPTSYPGHSILTEDEGEILGEDDCPCGRLGKTLRIHGRIQNAEIRGCSDTYERR